MESLDPAALFIDSLLDFSSDIGDDDDDDGKDPLGGNQKQQQNDDNLPISDSLPNQDGFPVFAEEELEWLSNQDAFPPIEAFDLLPAKLENLPTSPAPVKPENVMTAQKPVFVKLENVIKSQDPVPMKHEFVTKSQNPVSVKLENVTKSQSPVSVLGNGSGGVRIPVQARSKRRRQRRNFSDLSSQNWWFRYEEPRKRSVGAVANPSGRKCLHCQSEKTPQWRAGPLGPKTLCNACGVRYKSGRLLPEYRPASSPTFSEELHSNSHRKVLDMRRQKERAMFMPSSNNGWLVG